MVKIAVSISIEDLEELQVLMNGTLYVTHPYAKIHTSWSRVILGFEGVPVITCQRADAEDFRA